MFSSNVGAVLEFVNPIAGSTNHFKSVPGSAIQGEAVITVRKKTVRYKCIDFMLTGDINIQLSQSTYAVVVTIRRRNHLNQQIVNPIQLYRIGGPIVLEPGVYRYPLKLDSSRLPMPSYPQDPKCRIQYQVETVLRAEDNSGSYDKRFTSPVIIQKLNPIHPLERRAITATDQRTGCFTSSKVTMEATLPKSAFEPGETFRIRLLTSNTSNKILTPEVKLMYDRSCQLNYMSNYRGCQTVAKTSRESVEKIPALEDSGERYIYFNIPARCDPVTINTLGSTLVVNFFISVKLLAPWGCNDAGVTIPIRIGYNCI